MSRPSVKRNRSAGRSLLAGLATLALAAPALGQVSPRADLKVGQPPYYVGIPINLHLQVEGLEREPEPLCIAPDVDGGTLTLISISPNISTKVTIINGRTSRVDSVTFICRFSLAVFRPGEIRLGPFKVIQGSVNAESPVYSIPVKTIEPDPRVRIRITLPEGPVFVGQRLPVGVEWWIADGLQEKIQSYEIHSRIFEISDDFRLLPSRDLRRGEQTLSVHTDAGEKTFPAEVETRSAQGLQFLVVRTEQTMIPVRAGEFDLGSATVIVNEALRWQRDFFGGRRASQTQRLFARDAELLLVVREAPRKNRPTSYGGAIGRGFSFDVAADRSVVQRGDPIVLTFTVRGEGGLENVGLPDLKGPDALPSASFGLPSDRPPGELVDGSKIFRVPVRILDESLEEIPALPYSWFDPELGEYQTVHSRPIALSVRSAQLISAADVVAAQVRGEPTSEPEKNAGKGEPGSSQTGSFSLTGANLAIEIELERLLDAREPRGLRRGLVYALSVLALLAALFYRRQQSRDPELIRIRSACREQIRRIDAAASLPRKQALGEIASALRELGALGEEEDDPAWQALIAECDAVFYSPGSGSDAPVEIELFERARTLAASFSDRLSRSGTR